MDVGKKIQEARKKKQLSRPQLAALLGVNSNTVWRWEAGERQLRDEVKAKIAEVLGVPIGFLFGEAPDPTPEVPPRSVGEPPEWIDVVDMVACAGHGNGYPDMCWEVVDQYPLPATALMGYSWRCEKLRIIRIEGHSMEPHFSDGERILFAEGEVGSGDIAIVCWDGRLYIRGYIVDRDGTVRLKTYNPEFPEIVVHPEDDRLCVLGKVLGSVGGFRPARGFWG